MHLSSCLTPHSETEESGFFCIPLHFELAKGCGMTLDRL